jgi:kynurenine formamidase
VEKVSLSTHNGTHLDAPYHFHSTMNRKLGGKERSIAIDEVPLEWCFQPGVKLDFRHFADGYVVTAAGRGEAELERIGHVLQPLEIVVVNTRAGSRYGQPDFVASGCGMGYEATMYLLERGVRLTGTDAWSWDAPFVHTAKKYGESGDASLIWEGHKAGRDIGYCHLEKLHNLEALPADGFYISCFPHKIRGASAGWTRAVAIFDDADERMNPRRSLLEPQRVGGCVGLGRRTAPGSHVDAELHQQHPLQSVRCVVGDQPDFSAYLPRQPDAADGDRQRCHRFGLEQLARLHLADARRRRRRAAGRTQRRHQQWPPRRWQRCMDRRAACRDAVL